jgi:hypothetical protein
VVDRGVAGEAHAIKVEKSDVIGLRQGRLTPQEQ